MNKSMKTVNRMIIMSRVYNNTLVILGELVTHNKVSKFKTAQPF